uniref:Uncharacterized protein n=1 Tax=Biomphalaria glabrata TaxID=6526 RepID=A0A2C9M836_BIOGL
MALSTPNQSNTDDCSPVSDKQTVDQWTVDSCRLNGQHETQLSNSEAALPSHYKNCSKNPGHRKTVNAAELTANHLPEGYKDNDFLDFVLAASKLTVRLEVKQTSTARPALWPDKLPEITYPFYDIRNSAISRFGSGRVWHVLKFTSGYDDNNRMHGGKFKCCRCRKCETLDNPSKVWWEVTVSTATHVTFDEFEARHTYLRLFYSHPDSPLVTLDCVSLRTANIADDRSHLTCVTCDPTLGEKLVHLVEEYESLWRVVHEKFNGYLARDKIAFIVSHPHGCHAHVSFGQCQSKSQVGDDVFNHFLTYTVSTCPGSSGASLHVVGSTVGWFSIVQHVHSGSVRSDLNFSSVGYSKDTDEIPSTGNL